MARPPTQRAGEATAHATGPNTPSAGTCTLGVGDAHMDPVAPSPSKPSPPAPLSQDLCLDPATVFSVTDRRSLPLLVCLCASTCQHPICQREPSRQRQYRTGIRRVLAGVSGHRFFGLLSPRVVCGAVSGRRPASISTATSDDGIDDITDSESGFSLDSTHKSSTVHHYQQTNQSPRPEAVRQLSGSNVDAGSPIRRMASMPSSYTESAVPGPEEFVQAPMEERMPNRGAAARNTNFVPPPKHGRHAEGNDDRYLPSGSDYEYSDYDDGELTDSGSEFSLDDRLV